MIFVTDANIPRQITERLRTDGHTVIPVSDMELGLPDEVVLEIANREQAVLITADTDFGELIFRESRAAVGVILLRLGSISTAQRGAIVSAAIEQHGDGLSGSFTVISPGQVRIRRSV